ncbi:UNVERIFIED_CONTAM: argB [Trichonephila clavipes]
MPRLAPVRTMTFCSLIAASALCRHPTRRRGICKLGRGRQRGYQRPEPREAPMKKQLRTMQDSIATAKTLSEALPYLQRYSGAVVVVKFGGNAMGDDDAMAEFARDIVLMRQVGVNPVVVHGGGPMINDMLNKLGIKSEFVRGKRVTDKATVEVVEMILSGLVNKRIVQAINDQGGRAVGISGKDDDLMVCVADDPELGFVGKPVEMNVQVLRDLYNAGIIPVVAPVATGMEDNETFNVNGDTAAGAIAGALQADRLLLLTDVSGVKNAAGEVMTQITPEEVRQMTADGVIAGGMIPKTETALLALDQGVRAVTILDGRLPNACLLELFTDHGAGSQIRSTVPRVTPRVRR